IVEDWTYLELSSLGNADSLLFTLSSTDNGQFGMNTPAYFCIDNITTADMVSSTAVLPAGSAVVFPNPATEAWMVDWQRSGEAVARLYDMQGQLLRTQPIAPGTNPMQTTDLPDGAYLLHLQQGPSYLVRRLVKQ
ncbi:MAG TPA: DUF4465 domain-containing protein, partial [Phaeodactylibacter sp.]|nr:DUF4465 domain-containing protein [Phaeodactylibacter sp.]